MLVVSLKLPFYRVAKGDKMLDIIKRFKNREFCIDKYTYELHKILMNEEFLWDSGANYYGKEDYYEVGVRGNNLIWGFNPNIVMSVSHFIEQYNKQLSESLYVDLSNFTKDDLKDGQVVELENGEMCFVLPDRLICKDGWYDLNSYDEQLKTKIMGALFDIVKVYESPILVGQRAWNFGSNDKNLLDLIWERDSKKEKLQLEMQELLSKASEIKEQIDEL